MNTHQPTKEFMDQVLQKLAVKKSTSRPIGKNVFIIQPGWETEELKALPGCVIVDNSVDFHKELDNPSIAGIIIDKNTLLDEEMVLKIVDEHPLEKTIFLERE